MSQWTGAAETEPGWPGLDHGRFTSIACHQYAAAPDRRSVLCLISRLAAIHVSTTDDVAREAGGHKKNMPIRVFLPAG
jgi:hypothetical protein